MATGPFEPILRHVRRLADSTANDRSTDRQLLLRVLTGSDEAAFEALVARHGGLVLSVCRNALRNEHDAEDAFQATFLVLARKAAAIGRRENLAGWLYATARHCALQVRRATARRSAHERQAGQMPRSQPIDDTAWRELQAVLDEELMRLGEKYRVPFILCGLEGKSKAEAARELGWKEGTVSGRLARARKLLQQRLADRGVTLAAVLCATVLTQRARAAVPAALFRATVHASCGAGGRSGTSDLITPGVAQVVQNVLRTMFVARVKAITVLLVVGAVVCAAAFGTPSASPTAPEAPPVPTDLGSGVRDARTDHELLRGRWRVAEFAGDGIVSNPREKGLHEWHIIDDRITVDYGGGNIETLTFQLNETATPKAIDLRSAVDPGWATSISGIYELDGESLKFCYHPSRPHTRPRTFDRNPGLPKDSSPNLYILRRIPGPAEKGGPKPVK